LRVKTTFVPISGFGGVHERPNALVFRADFDEVSVKTTFSPV
jgi:hypothetical protein